MKQTLWRLAHIFLLVAGVAASVTAQVSGSKSRTDTGPPSKPASQAADRTNADETFEVNIMERRITERNFEASTSVAAGEETARGLSLRVGVAVGADEINVLLRNVRATVRFRASLDRVLERLNARRTPEAIP